MVSTPQNAIAETWISATWDDFLAISQQSEFENVRCYYDSGWMRIETMPIGSGHGQDNAIVAAIVSLYGTLKNIPYVSFTNTSFRKTGERECQPNLAYYIGAEVRRPTKTNQAIDIEVWGTPTLAIEISSTTLSEDLGQKRLLYERFGVREYWVIDVEAAAVFAFAVANGGSRQISVSAVLPGLAMSTVEEALRRSQTEDDGAVNRWLLQQFG
ncbi:Uma2 family endonuclease [Geitlerinema sp. CS-897]|nr:Uma2 family endonuclease [Geitlerinema sp. CS-897]